MSYIKHRGLIYGNGSPLHDKLVASVVKFLIQIEDFSPLDIELEKNIDKFDFDICAGNHLIEAETGLRQLRKEKVAFLRQNQKQIIVCYPSNLHYTKINFLSYFRNLADTVKEYWIFDVERMRIVTKFGPNKGY